MAVMPKYWDGNLYTIEKLDVFSDAMKDQTTFRLLFRKNFLLSHNIGFKVGYVQVFANEVLHDLDEKQIMHIFAEGASKGLEYPQEFMTTMAHWWSSPENKYSWKTLGYLTEPLNINYLASKYKEHWYDEGGLLSPKASINKGPAVVNMNDVNILPGVMEKVNHPSLEADDILLGCKAKRRAPVKDMIIHLNDDHRWTREQIADWLETLDVDLTFKAPEVRLKEQKQAELSKAYAALADAQKKISTYKELISALEQKLPSFESEIEKLEEDINE